MRRTRSIALVVAGMLLGTMLLTPVGAHVSQRVGHNWSHYRPLAERLFFTKAQSTARFESRCTPGTTDVSCLSVVSGSMVVNGGETRFGSVSESGGGSPTESTEFGLIAPFPVRVTNFLVVVGSSLNAGSVTATLRVDGATTGVTCTVESFFVGCTTLGTFVTQLASLMSVSVTNNDGTALPVTWSMSLERV